ncbi:MAG: hypothetical protein HYW48_09220 [Deltaproteobacteria bacterium]|nr:hypothetical protein [Deltaproteobacteria bacterium]
MNEELGNLRREILKSGLSFRSALRRAGIHFSAFHNWRLGFCQPNEKNQKRIRKALMALGRINQILEELENQKRA